MFDFFARVLTFFYSLWPSYGVMIILLTLSVRIVFTPLTVRGTKSMLELRRIQPEIKALQKKYKGDRAAMNLELQGLYREHKINPLGGCLPLIAQAPVFLVLYQVLRGLTRRTSDLGKSLGSLTSQCYESLDGCREISPVNVDPGFFDSTFFPRYLDSSSSLFKALSNATEMLWLGIDLSLSPSSAISESFAKGLPFILMIIIVGVLGFFQQRQIAGRNPDAEINPMQKSLMRILPIFLPVISFSLPAGLVLYFITTSLVGIAQQAFITRRVYKPWNVKEGDRKVELEESLDEEDDTDKPAKSQTRKTEQPKGLLGQLMSGPQPQDLSVHGRKRPTSVKPSRPKSVPPKAVASKEPSPPPRTSRNSSNGRATNPRESTKSRKSPQKARASNNEAARSKNGKGNQNNAKTTSRRVTPSKKEIETQNQRQKRRRR